MIPAVSPGLFLGCSRDEGPKTHSPDSLALSWQRWVSWRPKCLWQKTQDRIAHIDRRSDGWWKLPIHFIRAWISTLEELEMLIFEVHTEFEIFCSKEPDQKNVTLEILGWILRCLILHHRKNLGPDSATWSGPNETEEEYPSLRSVSDQIFCPFLF